MIDIENELFTFLYKAINTKYPETFITSDYVDAPSKFPHVSIVVDDNQVYRRTQSTDSQENHALYFYVIECYSNKINGSKSECKKIMNEIDTLMANIGFTRLSFQSIPNLSDRRIYRMRAVYRGLVSKNKTIYRG